MTLHSVSLTIKCHMGAGIALSIWWLDHWLDNWEITNLGFVVPRIFNQSNKNTQLYATINRKIYCFVVQTLLNVFRALLCPSSGARQTAVAASGFRMNVEVEVFSAMVGLLTLPPPHSYGNQRMQRQFDGPLMMGIIMSETCWAVSVRQSNKILRLIVASSWVFYFIDHSGRNNPPLS